MINCDSDLVKFDKNKDNKKYNELINYLKSFKQDLIERWLNDDPILNYCSKFEFIELNDESNRYLLHKDKTILMIKNTNNLISFIYGGQ